MPDIGSDGKLARAKRPVAAKDSALVSVGAVKFASGASLLAKFDGEVAGHRATYAGTGTVRVNW